MQAQKFLAEGGLILGSDNLYCTRVADIKINRDTPHLRGEMEGTNIYVIAKRRKILLHPPSLRYNAHHLFGLIQVHTKNGYDLVPFEYCPPEGKTISQVQLRDEPEQKIAFLYGDASYEWYTTAGLVQRCAIDLDHGPNLQVLYIGQAFGKTGQRLAVDRLSNHSALRRIQNDIQYEPEQELFVLMYRYGNQTKYLFTDGNQEFEAQASIQEEVDHIGKTINISVERRLRIYLAEAGLIRYFRPQYNEIFKRTFPSKKHAIVQKALRIGFSKLIVQISSTPMRSILESPALTAPKIDAHNQFTHYAEYSFHSDYDRQTFLGNPI
jgi:hypothetical protein